MQYSSYYECAYRAGRRISFLRQERGISRQELSRLSGLSLRFLAELEAGRGNIAFTDYLQFVLRFRCPLQLSFLVYPIREDMPQKINPF